MKNAIKEYIEYSNEEKKIYGIRLRLFLTLISF